MITKQSDLELPLLRVLVQLGGAGRPQDICPLVIEQSGCITEGDLAERIQSGTHKLTHRLQWVRQTMVQSQEMTSPQHGIWATTDRGQSSLESHSATTEQGPYLTALDEDYELTYGQSLLSSSQELGGRAT